MAFCAKCGSAVVSGGPAPGSAMPVGGPAPAATAGTGMADNVASALCYSLGLITGILFLVIAPYNQNRTVRFHAFQSIFMHVAFIIFWFVFWFVVGIVSSMLHIFSFFFLSPLIGLGGFILWLDLIISAYQGKKVVLPVIGPIAEQQA
jgi:uncharacterized membrane protein